jgi:hypothetical protein
VTFSRENLDGCSSEVINALQLAFEDVWAILYAHIPMNGEAATELKIVLSRTLVALASDGVTDRKELRRLALESMALRP